MIYTIIYLNIMWDFLSFFLIVNNLPNYHTILWKNTNDKNNYASKQLFAYLILFWGIIRLYGIYYNLNDLLKNTYAFEGFIFLYETLITKNIKLVEGLFISLLCFVIYLLII